MTTDMNQLRDHLTRAETIARELSAELIAESARYDTYTVNTLLATSNTLNALIEKLADAPSTATPFASRTSSSKENTPAPNTTTTRPKSVAASSDSDSDKFPIFFTRNNLLYKVGEKERREPSEHPGYWWKSVSLDEATEIMDIIYEYGRNPFRQTDILTSLTRPLPSYRIDIVVTSLRKLGFIGTVKRGVYQVDEGSPSSWIDALRHLPERSDLLMNAKK